MPEFIHELTEDSYGEALPSPLRVRVEAGRDNIILTLYAPLPPH